MEVYCFNILCCEASGLTLGSWTVSLPNVLCLMYLHCSVLCSCTFLLEESCRVVWGRLMIWNRHGEPLTWEKIFFLVQLFGWNWWWPGGRMYDVIYFNVWSDIICTAAKLLHGTSTLSRRFLFFTSFYQTGKNGILAFPITKRQWLRYAQTIFQAN